MKSFSAVLALIALLPAALATDMMVNSLTSVVECEPVQFTWTGGTSPYYLTLIPGGDPSGAALKVFPTTTGNAYTWTVDLAEGTNFSTSLKDSTGAIVYSAAQVVTAGISSTCVNSTVTETGGSAATVATTAATTTAAGTAATTSAGSSSSSAAASGSGSSNRAASSGSASGSSTASASTSSSGASHGATVGAFGLAGMMGLIGAALF